MNQPEFDLDRLTNLILRFLNRLKQTGRSLNTISAYRNDLEIFADFLVHHGFSPTDTRHNLPEKWVEYLNYKGRKSAASVRRAQMSVRTFLHFLIVERVIERSTLLEVKSPTQPKHGLTVISEEQFNKLVEALNARAEQGDEKSVRDLVIALFLGECGLKATEVAELTWGDVLLKPPSTDRSAGGSVRISGPHERVLDFDQKLYEGLILLRKVREGLCLSIQSDAKLLFGYLNMSRRARTASLHRHGVKFIVYEMCQDILETPYNSECFRNHAILKWLLQGLSSQQVANLAGYSSLNSLERFAAQESEYIATRRKQKLMQSAEAGRHS